MKRLIGQSFQRVFILTSAILTGSVFLRAAVKYSNSLEFGRILVPLLTWLTLAASEPFMNKQIRYYFPFYLVIQTTLVFVLVMMPDIDGFEVTHRVRQNDKYRLLPIILVTALGEQKTG
jgi:CheY-like chemotaxis protein